MLGIKKGTRQGEIKFHYFPLLQKTVRASLVDCSDTHRILQNLQAHCTSLGPARSLLTVFVTRDGRLP